MPWVRSRVQAYHIGTLEDHKFKAPGTTHKKELGKGQKPVLGPQKTLLIETGSARLSHLAGILSHAGGRWHPQEETKPGAALGCPTITPGALPQLDQKTGNCIQLNWPLSESERGIGPSL